MAPVSDRLCAATGDRDRAQLLLVGALSLAIALVAVALVLNSAIYTHNLASRQDSTADDVVTFARDARLGAGDHLDFVNRADGSGGYATVGNAYVDGVGSAEETINERAAVDVAATRIAHDPGSQVRGVRIVDDSGTFEPREAPSAFTGAEWVVAYRVRPRAFRVDVPPSGLSVLDELDLGTGDVEDVLQDPLGASDEVYTIEFTDNVANPGSGETWRVALYNDTSDDPTVAIHELGTNTLRTCSVDGTSVSDPLTLDLTGARFGGQGCAALSFVDDLPDTYSVKYYNGDEIEGSYELFVDVPIDGTGNEAGVLTDNVDERNFDRHCAGDGGGPGPTYFAPGSSNSPRVVPALYATDLEVRYDAPDIEFEGTQRVAPGEAGTDPVTPRVVDLDVTDDSEGDEDDDDTEFDLTVEVTDPNGDLDQVDAQLLAGGPVGTPDSASVAGDSDTVTLTVEDEDGGGDVYTVEVTVTDDAGNSRTVTQTHEADGEDVGCPP